MDASELAAAVSEIEAAQANGDYFPGAWFDRLTLDDADDTAGIDDEPARHWQRPAILAVANGKIIAKAQINLLQIVRQLEPKPELGRIFVAVVAKHIEADFILFDQRSAYVRRLRCDRADPRAQFLQCTRHLLQSIQLCIAIRSPGAAKEGQDKRSFGQ